MGQCCVKICTPQESEQIRRTTKTVQTIDIGSKKYEPTQDETKIRRIGIDNMKANLGQTSDPAIRTQPQGEVGEYQANCLAVEQLGISLVDYDQGHHGIDSIGKDKDGHFCIIEAKFTDSRDGQRDLEKYPIIYQNGNPAQDENGKTMTMEQAGLNWVTDRLNSMQQPGHELYSKKNSQVAKEIQEAMDRGETVRRILIHTNVNTYNMIVSEDHGDGDWQFMSGFLCLDK